MRKAEASITPKTKAIDAGPHAAVGGLFAGPAVDDSIFGAPTAAAGTANNGSGGGANFFAGSPFGDAAGGNTGGGGAGGLFS